MMKKFGKFFLATAVSACAMLAAVSAASAATVDNVVAGVATDEGRTISVTVNYGNAEAAQQSTVLVVKQGTDIATLADSDIKYIDQEAVSDSTVTYNFKLLSDDRAGVYDVYVGGTAVDAPGKTSFSFDTRKIIGTVTVLGDKTKATAVAKSGDKETAGTVASSGEYAIEVGQGTYSVVLGKAGYLYKTYNNVVVEASDVDLGSATLAGGDYNGDGVIDGVDIMNALGDFNVTTEEAAKTIDLNDDGVIDGIEIQNALANFNKSAE
jgi:hypothetical protein